MGMDVSRTLAAAFVVVFFAAGAAAQESPQVAELLPDAKSPAAIAVRPGGNAERHELFVADGEGHILRVASDALDQPHEVVAGIEQMPVALQFLNGRTILVVTADAPPLLRAYELPDDDRSLSSDQTKFEIHSTGEFHGRATAITLGPTALFVVGANSDAGWLLRSRVRSSVPGDLKPFVNTREKGGGSQPACVAISTRGWVVVGDAGQRDASEDSRLTFYHPTDPAAEAALSIEPGMLDVSAMAYSPQGSLFAADVAEADPQRGGVYRVDMDYKANSIGGKAVRVVPIERPTALAFAPDGTLYVIAREGANSESKLLRVTQVE